MLGVFYSIDHCAKAELSETTICEASTSTTTNKKIKEQLEKEKEDRKRKLTYMTGIAIDSDNEDNVIRSRDNNDKERTQPSNKRIRTCSSCGQAGHNKNNKKCPNYAKNKPANHRSKANYLEKNSGINTNL